MHLRVVVSAEPRPIAPLSLRRTDPVKQLWSTSPNWAMTNVKGSSETIHNCPISAIDDCDLAVRAAGRKTKQIHTLVT